MHIVLFLDAGKILAGSRQHYGRVSGNQSGKISSIDEKAPLAAISKRIPTGKSLEQTKDNLQVKLCIETRLQEPHVKTICYAT